MTEKNYNPNQKERKAMKKQPKAKVENLPKENLPKPEEKIAEELIDVIFYLLDASRLACPTIDMDMAFKEKLDKNRSRPYRYGEGHRNK